MKGRDQGDKFKNFAVETNQLEQTRDNEGRNRKQRKDYRDILLADLIGLDQQLNIESEEREYLVMKYLLYHYLIYSPHPQQPSKVGHCHLLHKTNKEASRGNFLHLNLN